MKKSNYILAIVLLIVSLVSSKGVAQLSDENTYIINQYFQLNKETTEKGKIVPITNKIGFQDDFVKLNQVGNFNTIDIKQNGNNSETVNQIGNKNYYSFINYYNNAPSSFNILQQGNSNNLQIYGQNSLIENISIIQNTNFKTLIIKNF